MKQKTILIAAAVLATATTATFAQDGKKFDGSYIGLEAGIDWTKITADTSRDKSFYYGGILGYRVQTDDDIVLGIEGSFGDSGYKNETTGAHANYEIGAALTLGSAFGDDGANLIYGKAGYVRTRFDASSANNDSYNDGGWRFGGGYERAISDNVSFRLGADYTTYGNSTNQWQGKAGVLLKF